MKTATEWAHEIDSYVTACMNEDTEYKGIGAFSPHPLEDFAKAIRQEQREACAGAVKKLPKEFYSAGFTMTTAKISLEQALKQILQAGKED